MKGFILWFLLPMLTVIVLQDNGLLNLKMKLYLLSIAHKGRLPASLFKDSSPPPETPGTPHPTRKPPPDETRIKRESLALPPRRPLIYDADEDDEHNKENLPPDDDRKGYGRKQVLQYLLEKLEEDLQLYQDEVLRELSVLRQKLGIPQ
uniref:E4 protein n=1 Tax=Human papillomavirus TaxID=10566 RepID=A0A385PM79_9PAPI|nr:MAG: E4 protein [Human papillomavirus]